MPGPPLAGLRLLVVEDEALVAMMLEDMLGDLGCTVVGPAGTLAAALELCRAPVDGALLDVNVGGQPVYPVADALAARGIPFLFVTGYAGTDIEPRYGRALTLRKPFDTDSLARAVAALVASAPA